MSNSATNLDLLSASQANKEVSANSLFDAASPAMLYGRRAVATAGLTWGYFGGTVSISGTPTQVANGTVTLAPSTTNYIEANPADGTVSVNQTGFTSGRTALYSVVTGASTVSSYTDLRVLGGGGGGATTDDIADAITAHEAESDPHPGYLTQAEGDARYAMASSPLGDGDKGDIVVSGGGTTLSIDSGVISAFGRTLTDDADAAAARTTLGLGTVATLASDTDTTLSANSDTKVATQKAVKAYVDAIATSGATDVMVFKGVIDCSANPNYPAADAGNLYKVSVAGKIGGASGVNVEAGDTIYCIADSTAAGTQAAVGASWVISQANLDGAVTGPSSATDSAIALFNGTGGKVVKDSSVALSTDGTFASNSDGKVPTEKAVKTYVTAAVAAGGGGSVALNAITAATAAATLQGFSPTATATNGGAVTLISGTAKGGSGSNTAGGALTLQGGTGATDATQTSHGGAVTVQGGTAGALNGSNGGSVTIQGGSGTGGLSSAGSVTIKGADGVNGGASPGNVLIQGGSNGTASTNGTVTIVGGACVSTGSAVAGKVVIMGGAGNTNTSSTGAVEISTQNGNALGTGSAAGNITITGGNATQVSFGNGLSGGAVTITAGRGGAPSNGWNGSAGANASLVAGQGGGNPSGGNAGNGGDAKVTAGDSGGGNASGGNVVLTPGAGAGTGSRGHVVLNGTGSALSTSATGGFTALPTCAGTPTGTPANVPTGCVAMVVDTTNSKFYLYIGGAWKSVTLT